MARSGSRGLCLGLLAAAALWSAGCAAAPPRKLQIAAASDLTFAMPELLRDFRMAHPELNPVVTFGSSGNFFTQLSNGAPFDIFLSADIEYPKQLAAKGLGARDAVFAYARGRLVVWVPTASALDPAKALDAPDLRHLAIANPEHAPYGSAAVAALQGMGKYAALQPKLVFGENISQTMQFAESGAADAAMIAMSLASSEDGKKRGRLWEVPPAAYPAIEQGGVVLRDSGQARAFADFLVSPGARETLKRYGFAVPGR